MLPGGEKPSLGVQDYDGVVTMAEEAEGTGHKLRVTRDSEAVNVTVPTMPYPNVNGVIALTACKLG